MVPQKMFVMYSQAASYPVHTLSLADAKPMHDGPSRTVALQVHLCLLCSPCVTLLELQVQPVMWQHRWAAEGSPFEAAQNMTRANGCLHCQALHLKGVHAADGGHALRPHHSCYGSHAPARFAGQHTAARHLARRA